MSTTFHITVREPTVVPVDQARAKILGTGRRPMNLDKLLAKSKSWARVEMTALRHLACTARTPWYLTSGYLGGGTSAANLAKNSIGVITRCVPPRPAYICLFATRRMKSPALLSLSLNCAVTATRAEEGVAPASAP